MWKVYKRTCPNGKVYIGITSKSLEERMGSCYQNNLDFALAIKKYGKENIKSEVLEECETYDDARILEDYYIDLFQDICYNKAGNHKNTRNNASAQSCLHSDSCTVEPPQETLNIRPHYKEHIVPLTPKPKNRRSCPIDVYNLEGEYINTYPSAKEASLALGVNHGDIISCCKGFKSDGKARYQVKGYIFRYSLDKLEEFPEEHHQCKKVNQYTKEGKYIKTFDSLTDAWLETGASIGSIGKVCKGLAKTSGGFVWKYA